MLFAPSKTQSVVELAGFFLSFLSSGALLYFVFVVSTDQPTNECFVLHLFVLFRA